MIKISIIVPTHNRLELLRRKLEALEAQDLPPERFEAVVVADGCGDGTRDFLAMYRPGYALKWLETPGLGAASARNRAVEQAEGEVLLFSDDDVVLEPNALRIHLEAQQTPAVCMGAFRYETGEVWQPVFRRGQPHWVGLGCANTSVPAEAFRVVGGFWEDLEGYGGEDLELGYRLHHYGLPFRYLAEARGIHAGGPSMADLSKAHSAGRQAMHIYLHHRNAALGLELGVHPALLHVKMAVLPWTKRLLGPRGDYELAYACGAWAARHEDLPGFASHGAEDPPASPKDSGGEDGSS